MTILKLIRLSNWLKNIFVLFPLVFSLQLFVLQSVVTAIIASVAFCFMGSAIYVLNDLLDIEKDKLHPRKKHRPLPSGKIKKQLAIFIMVVCVCCSAGLAYFLPLSFQLILLGYFVLNISYNFILKQINIIESITLGVNFVLRVLAGCYAIAVVPSHWILVITFFVALFLTFIKRKSELKIIQQNAGEHRKVLKNYSLELLNRFVYICATITLTAYMLYTIDEKVIAQFNTDLLIYSTVFVVTGLFRFIQLSESNKYHDEGDPTTLLLKDTFAQITFIAWLVYMVVVIYFQKIAKLV